MELLYFKNKFNLLKSEFFCVLTHHLIILMTNYKLTISYKFLFHYNFTIYFLIKISNL